MTHSTLNLSQSKDLNDDDIKPASKPTANTKNDLSQYTIASSPAQTGTLDPTNVAQYVFDQARISYAILNELELET
jgi:hypothetical protein